MRCHPYLSPSRWNESSEKKAACSQAALCKEAKEEGKSLRKGDARCSPGLRQDTRIEEVSILGRGLKSFVSFTCLFICCLYKQLGNQRILRKCVEYVARTKLFILLLLCRKFERYRRKVRCNEGSIGVIRRGTQVPLLDLFVLKLCFSLLLHRL